MVHMSDTKMTCPPADGTIIKVSVIWPPMYIVHSKTLHVRLHHSTAGNKTDIITCVFISQSTAVTTFVTTCKRNYCNDA